MRGVHLHSTPAGSIDSPRHCIDPADAVEHADSPSTSTRLGWASSHTWCPQCANHVAFAHVEHEYVPFVIVVGPKQRLFPRLAETGRREQGSELAIPPIPNSWTKVHK